MLESLHLRNFTVFQDVSFDVSPGLNVIIGENATGKSHFLKLAYSVAHVMRESSKGMDEEIGGPKLWLSSKSSLQRQMAQKLVGVFKPDTLGRLCRREPGRSGARVAASFGPASVLEFSFSTNSKKDVVLHKIIPKYTRHAAPIFFPAKEVLSFYPGFATLYEQRELDIDETYYDLCKLLSAPLLRGKHPTEVATIVKPLEDIMGGSVRMDAGRFYLHQRRGKMEINLVAEGLRKVAMLAYLAANGSLRQKGILFWDEPETNLNPRIMTKVAQTLAELAQRGVQVMIATHSLFLMKELSLWVERSQEQIPARFFCLRLEDDSVALEQGNVLEDLQTIISLEEVLDQDDREQEWLREQQACAQ